MANNNIWVRATGNINDFKYEWGIIRKEEIKNGYPANYTRLLHMLVYDIYRDKIPVGNIEMSDCIRSDFENFKTINRELITNIEMQLAIDWNNISDHDFQINGRQSQSF